MSEIIDADRMTATTTDGRLPGQRGQATRQRLLDATLEMLSTTPWRVVKVIDIAKAAGTSPATFYQYFENVEQAITVLAEDLVVEASELADLVGGDWSEETSWETALRVAEGFLSYWEANRVVFRILEFGNDATDTGLRGLRVRALNAITVALARTITMSMPPRTGQKGAMTSSPAGSDPMAVAGTLVAMLTSVAAHRYGFEFWGIRTANLIDSQARFIHLAVTGRPGPEAMVGREPLGTLAQPRTGPVLGGEITAHRTPRR